MRPTTTLVQMPYRNPHASQPLILPVLVVCNTSDEDLERNIRANAARDFPWIKEQPPHDRIAVLCGGGPSLAEYIHHIQEWHDYGGDIFAMNAASQFLRAKHVEVDYQVIADAKPETASLYDPEANHHLIASQVDVATLRDGNCTTVWHLCVDETMDRLFPVERAKRGGYSLIGGGAAVGNAALCLAYVMGYRTFEIYGYDSSHRGDASHAYPQDMNRFIPTVDVEWAGKTYRSSVAMKAQAEKFQISAQAIKQAGGTIHVHGDGLLPAMWNTPAMDLTERDKYRLMWATDSYRDFSPAEQAVDDIMERLRPSGLVLDFGCGTGRAALELSKRGLDMLLIDFADNCRDEEAMQLPFLEWDLARPMPPHAHYGICCDVMEHIQTDAVHTVVSNIMATADKVYFQISTVPDAMGVLIGHELHLTVKPHDWWRSVLSEHGAILYERSKPTDSVFVVERY